MKWWLLFQGEKTSDHPDEAKKVFVNHFAFEKGVGMLKKYVLYYDRNRHDYTGSHISALPLSGSSKEYGTNSKI